MSQVRQAIRKSDIARLIDERLSIVTLCDDVAAYAFASSVNLVVHSQLNAVIHPRIQESIFDH